jgi:hypothetical protein
VPRSTDFAKPNLIDIDSATDAPTMISPPVTARPIAPAPTTVVPVREEWWTRLACTIRMQ